MDEFDKVEHVTNENQPVTSRETNGRVNTGIGQLDELLSGGLPRSSITLVSGTPGSGKSILCFHYILEGLKKGEDCLYLTSDERIENIIKQAGELGFNFQQWVEQGKLKFMYLDLDKSDIHKDMDEYVEAKENVFKYQEKDSILVLNKDNQISNSMDKKAENIIRKFIRNRWCI